MQVKFVLIGGAQDGASRVVESFPVTVGREETVSFPIDDRWSSRRHCQILVHDGQLMVRDLASRHGTYVNGERVEDAPLATGDRVMVGLTELLISHISQPVVNVNRRVDETDPTGEAELVSQS